MWRTLMTALYCICGAGILYVFFRSRKLFFARAAARRSRLLGFAAALLPLAGCACFLAVNRMTAAVVLVHLVLIWLLSDLTGWAGHKISRRPVRRYTAGYMAIALTALIMGVGWFCAHHVWITHYTFTSAKLDAPLRAAMIADSHLGVTLDKESFSRQMERLAAEKPEVLQIVGDFVDDDTNREDMLAACDALGKLELPYGVYYVYGNHDRGYFRYRAFTAAELLDALERNGVTVLADESVLIDDRFYITGRRDRSMGGRASMQQLYAGLDTDRFLLVCDHQPNAYEEEAAAGADLVLSGHTHGGHLFPMGQIGLLMGSNDRRYGTETRGLTQFIVTSGISGWAVPIKTGCWSEMVIADILPEM